MGCHVLHINNVDLTCTYLEILPPITGTVLKDNQLVMVLINQPLQILAVGHVFSGDFMQEKKAD